MKKRVLIFIGLLAIPLAFGIGFWFSKLHVDRRINDMPVPSVLTDEAARARQRATALKENLPADETGTAELRQQEAAEWAEIQRWQKAHGPAQR